MASVILTWTASTSTVQGYNVYKGTAGAGSEGSTPINGATLITGTTYTDNNVTDGEVLDYFATAVANGVESIHSNEVTARVLPAAPTNLMATTNS